MHVQRITFHERLNHKYLNTFLPLYIILTTSLPPPHTHPHTHPLRINTLTADNLYIAEIASTGSEKSSIRFSMYARLDGGFLSGSALETAVIVSIFLIATC